MGLKAAVQALGKAEELKQSVLKCQMEDFISPAVISMQKQIQQLYRHILVVDLHYGLEKKIEQDLWNVGFKIMISALQDIIRDKKTEHKAEASALLNWGLSGASGFYLTLLQETWGVNKSKAESNPALTFLAQHCLVHLGDLSRYQNHKQEAQNYYKHAIKIAPDCGQAYNQLALLDSVTDPSSALKVAALYCRAFGAPQNFAPAHNNLLRLLDEYKTFVPTQDVSLQSVDDYFGMFLQQICHILNHSVIYSNISISSENNITEFQYIQMFILCLYCFERLLDTRICSDIELSEEEQSAKAILLNLLIASFPAFHIDHPAVKTVYLSLCWLEMNSGLLQTSAFKEQNKHLWNNLADLLNSLPTDCHHNIKDNGMPLPEDLELSGYCQLHTKYDISLVTKTAPDSVRYSRILQKGLWLVKQTDFLCVRCDDNGFYKFSTKSSTSAINSIKNCAKNLEKIQKEVAPPIKPKRTNVAMQAILQKTNNLEVRMHQSSNENLFDLPKSAIDVTSHIPVTPTTIAATLQSFEHSILPQNTTDNLDFKVQQSPDRFFNQAKLPDPPLPPLNWILDIDSTKNNHLPPVNDSLFTNTLFQNDIIPNSSCTSPFHSITGSPWGASGSYSLFSGPSPLEKLLQDQKKKGENQNEFSSFN